MLALVGGVGAVILGIWGLASWWVPFLTLIQGCIPLFLLIGGIISIAVGYSSIKEKAAEKKEKATETKSQTEKVATS